MVAKRKLRRDVAVRPILVRLNQVQTLFQSGKPPNSDQVNLGLANLVGESI